MNKFILCPDCKTPLEKVIERGEKPDGTCLGYPILECPQCGYWEDESTDKKFSAGICPSAELIEITTLADMDRHRKIYICGNALCTQANNCVTTCEKNP